MPKISVIVPIYKVEAYLKECVDSLLNQTFDDFELILVDDGSPDGCPSICDEYKNKDKRVIVIHKSNGGLSSARNAGIDIANGMYLSFVDSDDFVYPTFLESLLRLIEDGDADLSICSHKKISDYSNALLKEKTNYICLDKYSYWNFAFKEQADDVVAWNKLYRKDLFNDIRYPSGKIREDEFVIHRIIDKCRKIAYTPNELYAYRLRPSSIMNKNDSKKIINYLEAIGDRINFHLFNGYSDQILKISLNNFLTASYKFCCLKNKTKSEKKCFASLVDNIVLSLKKNYELFRNYRLYFKTLNASYIAYRFYYSCQYRKKRRYK